MSGIRFSVVITRVMNGNLLVWPSDGVGHLSCGGPCLGPLN